MYIRGIEMSGKRISIIGSGWVGTAIGKGFTGMGYETIFYDVVNKDLPNFTMDISYAIENSDVSFISVPTPTTSEGIDLSYIKDATKSIGKVLATKRSYQLVVVKSTIVPGSTENVVIPTLEKYSGKKAGNEIGICMNPEFLTEISGTWSKDEGTKKDFFTEDRIVIGEYDKNSGDVLEELYKPLNKPIFRTDLKTAETIKYASNCMLATKISYWNALFLVCKDLGIDSHVIADVVGLDPRIGKYGTVHGKAFGGKCLPKDLKAFVSFAEKYRDMKLLKAVDELNEEIKAKYGVRE
ncbi:UDPglucose 6-dehydrogenase [Candidatus Methanophagaceae archaeon]|nr:UDPglucose 6-dehydrogenase [Methanophagales archaeon]